MGTVPSQPLRMLFDDCPICQHPTNHFNADASVDMRPRGAPPGPQFGRRQSGHDMDGARMADVVRRSDYNLGVMAAPCCLQPFHVGCLITWIVQHNHRTCPHCRAEMRFYMHLATDEQMVYTQWRESPFVCGFMAVGVLATVVGGLALMVWILPLYAVVVAVLAIITLLAHRLCTLPIRRFHPIARPFVRALHAAGAFLVRVWRLEYNFTTGEMMQCGLIYAAMWGAFKLMGVMQ
jgi:hypothetical protein